MPRNADDILIGGGRVYINNAELGWLSGEIKLEEQASPLIVKESEGGTVLTINLDKEVHFTFNLLDVNLATLQKLNQSMGGFVQNDDTYEVQFKHKKRSGGYRTITIPKGKISGTFTPLLINQDNASPIPINIIAIADDNTNEFYTITDEGSNSSGGIDP